MCRTARVEQASATKLCWTKEMEAPECGILNLRMDCSHRIRRLGPLLRYMLPRDFARDSELSQARMLRNKSELKKTITILKLTIQNERIFVKIACTITTSGVADRRRAP